MAEALIRRNDVLIQLQQIFPNQDREVIEAVMKNVGVGFSENFTPYIVNRCIDYLVQIKPVKKGQFPSESDSELLSPIQSQVATELKMIFPNFSDTRIKASVKHPDNFQESVTSPQLLQRCIDDLLEGRTAQEDHSPTTDKSITAVNSVTDTGSTSVNSDSGQKTERSRRQESIENNQKTEYRIPVLQFDSDDDSELVTAADETELAFSCSPPTDVSCSPPTDDMDKNTTVTRSSLSETLSSTHENETAITDVEKNIKMSSDEHGSKNSDKQISPAKLTCGEKAATSSIPTIKISSHHGQLSSELSSDGKATLADLQENFCRSNQSVQLEGGKTDTAISDVPGVSNIPSVKVSEPNEMNKDESVPRPHSDSNTTLSNSTEKGYYETNLYFKKSFQEYRTDSSKTKTASGLNLNSNKIAEKEIVPNDSSRTSSELFKPYVSSTSMEDTKNFMNYRNNKNRTYMLMDLSSDSEDEADNSKKDILGNADNETLPTISIKTRDRDPPSPQRCRPEQGKSTFNKSLFGKSNASSFLDHKQNVYKSASSGINPPQLNLPQSKFVAVGSASPEKRTAKNQSNLNSLPGQSVTNLNSSKSQGKTYQHNKPATFLIESTCKITYSPDENGIRDTGPHEPLPSLLKHVPQMSVSFPLSHSQQHTNINANNFNIDGHATSASAQPSLLFNNHSANINHNASSTLTRHNANINHIAAPRMAKPYLNPRKNLVTPTLHASDQRPRSFASPTLQTNKSINNIKVSSNLVPVKISNNTHTSDKETVQSRSRTTTKTLSDEKVPTKRKVLDINNDLDVELLHYEPATAFEIDDSPETANAVELDTDDINLNTNNIIELDSLDEMIIPALGNEKKKSVTVEYMGTERTLPTANTTKSQANRPAKQPDTAPINIDLVETKTHEQVKEDLKNEVLQLFPNVDSLYLEDLCNRHEGMMALNNICAILLDNDYPKKQSDEQKDEPEKVSVIDFYKHNQSTTLLGRKRFDYINQFHLKLLSQFVWLQAIDIRKVSSLCKGSYALTYRALQTVWKQGMDILKKDQEQGKKTKLSGLIYNATVEMDSHKTTLKIRLLKSRRNCSSVCNVMPELQAEIDFTETKIQEMATEEDHQFALQLNEQEYEDEGQCIECGCCYGEFPFDNMVQCLDGHLFCEDCLRQFAKESVFGQGKAQLLCMTEGCTSAFPKNQLEKALPLEVLMRYEDRVAEENLNLADIGDLVRCPGCDYAAIMDPGDRVFTCMNDKCRKETCRHCKEDWSEHFGKKCSEIEKKDEVKLRLEYEEKMTKAKVRTCHRCKSQFMKDDGCNKMTCRCGAKMCYICRKPSIEYNHFCQHPRDPGKKCTLCDACSLWTNPEEDDNRAVAEIQKEAAEVRKTKGFMEDKVIGVPDGPPAKKMRI